MALTYQQTADLMGDLAFRGRIKVACLKFSDYIFGEATSTPAHNSRLKWAQRTYQMPDASASEIAPGVVMDPAVQADGAAIIDTALQSAVENTVNKMI